MKVLIACEYSGVVREAFAARGHYALSCDLEPTEQPGNHYQGDIADVLHEENWDMMIGHPPCTYGANSGAKHLYEPWSVEEKATQRELLGKELRGHSPRRDEERWANMRDAAAFFNMLWNTPIPRVALENPIPHRHFRELLDAGRPHYIQPWQFGHMESKKTGLWLRNLPPLAPTKVVHDEMMQLPKNVRERVHSLGPSDTRWMERSRTFTGIAEAMADQWGGLELSQAA